MKADVTFAITGWEQAAYDEPAEGPVLARATVRKRFSGALEAESVAELLMCGEVGYVASERVTGTLRGRTGTFVLQHGATLNPDGSAFQFGNVVPGSGTGELAGLRGTARMEHEKATLEYELG